jgi:hypothetical protein
MMTIHNPSLSRHQFGRGSELPTSERQARHTHGALSTWRRRRKTADLPFVDPHDRMPVGIFRIVPKWLRHKILAAARRAYTLRHPMPPIRQQHPPTQRRFWVRLGQYRPSVRKIAATPTLWRARAMIPDRLGAVWVHPFRRRGKHLHKAWSKQQRQDEDQHQLPGDQLTQACGPASGGLPYWLLWVASSVSVPAQTTAALVRELTPGPRDVRVGVGRPPKIARITRRGTDLEANQMILS